ncbi:MAG: aminoglycoside phosphotransferase family protein [Rhodocyclales bacterium]|nr:aminoglycoside phosphotransferase family protein [Rhodocyclales bacterium]
MAESENYSPEELNYAVLEVGGWEYLIPSLRDQKVLCIDSAGLVASLVARQCGQVVVLADDRCVESVGLVMKALGNQNVTIVPQSHWLRDSGGRLRGFDGMICHYLAAGAAIGGDLNRLDGILASARRALRSGGFIYIGIRNAYSIRRILRRTDTGNARPVSVRRVAAKLDRAGFTECHRHPFLIADHRLLEVLGKNGYESTKNPGKFVERIKGVLFGPLGSRFFAPAYGVVAHSGSARESLLVKVMGLLQEKYFPSHQGRGALVAKQYLVLNGGKVILKLGFADSHDDDFVAVLVRDHQALARREREAEMLDLLSRSNSRYASLFPRTIGRIDVDGVHCFVLTGLPGATIDQDVSELDEVTNKAFEFLLSFHQETRRAVRIDSAVFDGLFAALFAAARERNACQSRELVLIEGMIRQRAIGMTLPTVWMHGDFKVENVMYDPRTLALSGVIDWELSQSPGLPLLDLKYLNYYGRIIQGTPWLDAFREVCLLERRGSPEERRCRQYADALQLGADWIPILNVMFLIHHFGCRFKTSPSDHQMQEQVTMLMRECIRMLEATASRVVESSSNDRN